MSQPSLGTIYQTSQTKPKNTTVMKKIIYTLLIALSSTLVFTACTEEEVAPATQTSNTGALEIDFVKK